MAKAKEVILEFDGVDNKFVGSKEEESVVERSLSSRAKLRDQMAEDVNRFMSKGGSVEEVPKSFRADPPKKPTSNYGSRPI